MNEQTTVFDLAPFSEWKRIYYSTTWGIENNYSSAERLAMVIHKERLLHEAKERRLTARIAELEAKLAQRKYHTDISAAILQTVQPAEMARSDWDLYA